LCPCAAVIAEEAVVGGGPVGSRSREAISIHHRNCENKYKQ